jgi:hypothetical protein
VSNFSVVASQRSEPDANQSSNQVTHLGFLFTVFAMNVQTVKQLTALGLNQKSPRTILKLKIRHENEDLFENGLSKKSVEIFFSYTTIPSKGYQIFVRLSL